MLKIHTTSDELLHVLRTLMGMPSLANFRLVGGTALSLLQGHRKSEDIDLFTHQPYGSVDFEKIEAEIAALFPYARNDDRFPELQLPKNDYGLHLHVGDTEESSIKTDILNWTEAFLDEAMEMEGIRLATFEEIALMKLDTISRGGRKKDFWDLSEIIEHKSLNSLLELYPKKYPYYSLQDVKSGLTNFEVAEKMPDPICLKGKYWELIKEEITNTVKALRV
ncbi:MAG: nucleotidyl transferase AbiEii/AbiGii toxin family protein [Bacteroidetes bacterium]|nr:nucleotidyl transferase AbiEii/AbiGii toxin family protein [Bacteroidota bacterium]